MGRYHGGCVNLQCVASERLASFLCCFCQTMMRCSSIYTALTKVSSCNPDACAVNFREYGWFHGGLLQRPHTCHLKQRLRYWGEVVWLRVGLISDEAFWYGLAVIFWCRPYSRCEGGLDVFVDIAACCLLDRHIRRRRILDWKELGYRIGICFAYC